MLETLLKFENESKVLTYRYQYKGMLVWPFIRFYLFRKICEETNGFRRRKLSSPQIKSASFARNAGQLLFRNPFLSGQKNIMFFISGGTNIKRKDGKYFNRLIDYYAKVYEKNTYVLELGGIQNDGTRSIRGVHRGDIIEKVVERCCAGKTVLEKDRQMCNELIDYLQHAIPVKVKSGIWNSAREQILWYAQSICYYDRLYSYLIKRVNPKIVFVGCGCYGYQWAVLIKILKEQKICCAEIQHGWVGKTHESYNYSQLLQNSEEYKEYLPDYFLTFGDCWEQNIRLPVKKYVLGNPNFAQNRGQVSNSAACSKNILFVASTEHKEYIKLLEELLPLLGEEYSIEFRLHPKELAASRWYHKFEKYKNFKLYSEGNIYEAFGRCEYATSDFSTALFEAAAVGKKVLIYGTSRENTWNHDDIGIVYHSAEELIDILDKGIYKNVQVDYIFETRWKNNYKRFIKQVITEEKQK